MEEKWYSWFLCTEVPQNPTLLMYPWQVAFISTVLLELSAHKMFEALWRGQSWQNLPVSMEAHQACEHDWRVSGQRQDWKLLLWVWWPRSQPRNCTASSGPDKITGPFISTASLINWGEMGVWVAYKKFKGKILLTQIDWTDPNYINRLLEMDERTFIFWIFLLSL